MLVSGVFPDLWAQGVHVAALPTPAGSCARRNPHVLEGHLPPRVPACAGIPIMLLPKHQEQIQVPAF